MSLKRSSVKWIGVALIVTIFSSEAQNVAALTMDDRDEAIKTVMRMKDPIMNYKTAEVEQLGNEAIGYSEKALDAAKSSESKDKLKFAIDLLRRIVYEAKQDKWSNAAQYWASALESLGQAGS